MTTEVRIRACGNESVQVIVHTNNGKRELEPHEEFTVYVYPGHTVVVEEINK